MISNFTGSPAGLRAHLNMLVDAANKVQSFRGGSLIRVTQGPAGYVFDLNVEALLPRIAKPVLPVPDDPYVMLPVDRTVDVAQTDSWERESGFKLTPAGAYDNTKDGVQWNGPRVVYDDTAVGEGLPVLRVWDRVVTWDAKGNIASVSVETANDYIIDTPTECVADPIDGGTD